MPENLTLFWGDPHIHSNVSRRCFKFGVEPDGYDGSPRDCFRYARDEAEMDFAACTDHDCTREQREMTDEEWDLVRLSAAETNDPGRFITFSAFEWSNRRQGHYNVYYSHDEAPLLAVDDYRTPDLLWEALRESDPQALTIPHHLARQGMPNDWDYFDPQFEPVVEICSIWGNYEYEGNPFECDPNWAPSEPSGFARVGLSRGLRFGFIGGGDIHDGRAGGHTLSWQEHDLPERWQALRKYRRNPLGGGIAGVYAKELTRESLLEGIRARRTVAATGRKTAVKMWLDDTFLGGAAPATEEQLERRVITVEAEADVPVRSLEIIRNGLTLVQFPCCTVNEAVEFVDERPLAEVLPQTANAGGGLSVHYYARVTRDDYRMAWGSPVWLDLESP